MDQSIDTVTLRAAIEGRCSVRAYAPGQIDPSKIQAVLAMAVRAPTAMHGEPWQFLVVQDARLLKQLSDRAKEMLRHDAARLHPDPGALGIFSQPGFNVFYDAPTLIVICAATTGHFASADCWLAAENLMLAAHAMGLGTCVIGSAVTALNLPEVKRELGIPDGSTAVVPVIVGVPAGEVRSSARKAPHILAWLKAAPSVPR